MKKILLTFNDIPTVNIGDYIQSLAAKQYFDDDEFILMNRDELNTALSSPAKVAMNSWFTYKPENFPPSSKVIPLFLSFHLNSIYGKSILSNKKTLKYLKKHEPIGCRDYNTVKLLESKDIKAYFSSCLTTTFDVKYESAEKLRDEVYIVDPLSYMPEGKSLSQIIITTVQYILHFRGVNKILKNYRNNNRFDLFFNKIGIGRVLLATKSYLLLRNILSKDLMDKAIYLTHFHTTKEFSSDKERFAESERLLLLYSKAKLVITSRIHCALPCLGLKTRVVYLYNGNDNEKSKCRLAGLLDFFNVIRYQGGKVVETFLSNNEKINSNNLYKIRNKDNYCDYADKLKKITFDFFK